jgi:AraC family transcriptional regulator
MERFSPTRFPAPIVRSRAFGEVVLSETHYGPGSVLATHAHEYACLAVVLDGTFRERFGRDERLGRPGLVIVRPEGEPHEDVFDSGGGICLNVELPPGWVARMAPLRLAPSAAFSFAGRRLHRELLDPDDLSQLEVESLIVGLLADRGAPAPAPRWLGRAKELMHAEFAGKLTLDAIARVAGVHPVHLAATFRRVCGVTVAAYVRQLRMDFACRELTATSKPLTEIAYAAGFADQSHFCRLFRQALRMTPRAYRAKAGRP